MSSVNSQYIIGKKIGEGAFGVVRAAQRSADDLLVAIKFILRHNVRHWESVDQKDVPQEVLLLKHAQGIPGVVRFVECIEEAAGFAVVMERVDGDDLFDHIQARHGLGEFEAKRLFAQVVQTVAQCHQKGILHRDIKDENILIDRVTGNIRLVDFGCATFLNPNDESFHIFSGTRHYAPPEWIRLGEYRAEPSTVWQLGTLLYSMVNDEVPFDDDTEILECQLMWWKPISYDCRNLITTCLESEPSARASLAQILAHKWLANASASGTEAMKENSIKGDDAASSSN
jgi:serine/threonine protein kinase